MNKHVGDQCFKCNLGQFDVKKFVVPGGRRGNFVCCEDCPQQEHLHLFCTKCDYMVWDKTAEQRQLEHDAELSR